MKKRAGSGSAARSIPYASKNMRYCYFRFTSARSTNTTRVSPSSKDYADGQKVDMLKGCHAGLAADARDDGWAAVAQGRCELGNSNSLCGRGPGQ